MSKREKISNTSIKNLVPSDKRLNDSEIAGFHALISPKGKISYYFYYRIDGKQANIKLGTHGQITATQARDLAKTKAGDVAKGVDVQVEKKLAKQAYLNKKNSELETFLDNKYFPWLKTRNAKTAEKTIKVIKTGFPDLLSHELSSINPWIIEKWRSRKREVGLKPSTINSYVNSLKGAFSRAVEWGIIESHDLNKVKSLRVDNVLVRYLTKAQENSLRLAMSTRDQKAKEQRQSGNKFREDRNYPLLPTYDKNEYIDYLEPLVILAMNTGMRKGEIFNLKWSSVDLVNSRLTVAAENAKSGKSRIIPLNTEAKSALFKWERFNSPYIFVFEGEVGKPLKDIKKAWANLLAEAKIYNFRFHDLRHHFASKLVMAGVDLNTVRELLGHHNLDMTLRYAHLAPEHTAAAVNLIG
jgi:integrase